MQKIYAERAHFMCLNRNIAMADSKIKCNLI